MDPSSLLAQLRDVHAHTAPGWWPLAPGWWMLIVLALLLLAWCLYRIAVWHRRKAWRRDALREYRAYRKAYQASPDSTQLTQVVTLLKRAAASSYGDASLLALSSEQWQQLLAEQDIFEQEEIEILSHGHYAPKTPVLSDKALTRCERWIRSLK